MILVGEVAQVVLSELTIRSDVGGDSQCWHRFSGTPEYCQSDREFGSIYCPAHKEFHE